MKTHLACLPALALVAALPLAAQTTPPPAVHHTPTTTATHHTVAAGGGCANLPPISSKIPALPSSVPCAKALYTLTRTPDVKADYISPLVSTEVREGISGGPATYSLLYIDTQVGTGELVKAGKYLSVKYTGYLPDGTKFDSSDDHPGKEPITFQYGMHRVIQGWDTGFEGLKVGGKRRIFIPYQLAYGDAGRPPVIPAKSELIFDMEVVSSSDTEPKKTPPPAPAPKTPPPAAGQPATTTPPPAGSTPPASTNPKP
jgi:peptidylprolyl isomerase